MGKDTWWRCSHDMRVALCENFTWKTISLALMSSVSSFVCLLLPGGGFSVFKAKVGLSSSISLHQNLQDLFDSIAWAIRG